MMRTKILVAFGVLGLVLAPLQHSVFRMSLDDSPGLAQNHGSEGVQSLKSSSSSPRIISAIPRGRGSDHRVRKISFRYQDLHFISEKIGISPESLQRWLPAPRRDLPHPSLDILYRMEVPLTIIPSSTGETSNKRLQSDL